MCVQTHKKFWDSWHEFEVKCGNEDTFRDMLRTKRSVQAVFSTKVCVCVRFGPLDANRRMW